jgi:LuxR family maltose regulon positive regulatory protein
MFANPAWRLDDRPVTKPAETTGQSRSPSVTPLMLTRREREVLEYAPSMLSAAEIGSQLFVSVNTVKAHPRSIYRLGVTRRRVAVIQARRRGLL